MGQYLSGTKSFIGEERKTNTIHGPPNTVEKEREKKILKDRMWKKIENLLYSLECPAECRHPDRGGHQRLLARHQAAEEQK